MTVRDGCERARTCVVSLYNDSDAPRVHVAKEAGARGAHSVARHKRRPVRI